ncbi:glycosyltransferase [soil metagenome]
MSRVAAIGSATAALMAAHAAVNARLVRTPGEGVWGGRVSVLVPARDEAARIGPCVRALLDQRGAEDLELLVLDDGSTDGTAAVVRRTAAGDGRLRLLAGRPLAEGWLGKPHACAQLAEAATGDVLVFVDADVVLCPGGLAATVAALRGGGLDLVSPYPLQLADGLGPRLVQPLLQWSWLTFLPLRLAERLPATSLCAANGQLLACDAAAYRAAGGHAAVRGQVIEDVALARAFKAAGFVATVADGTGVATCRMYGSWPELRDGYTKSLWAAFPGPAGAVGAAALLAVCYLLPPLHAVRALLRGRPRQAVPGLAGYAAGVAGRLIAARRTGGRSRDALAHPVSIAALLALLARSWWARATGRLVWKGRELGGSAGRDHG